MKRSDINKYLVEAKDFFTKMNFILPPWSNFKADDWKGNAHTHKEIISNMLGWDITDFAGNDFGKKGLILFTLRNGFLNKDNKPYAEKIMIVRENQETPLHFHRHKMEDIINRGGGNLVIEIHGSDANEQLSKDDIVVKIDGVERTVKAGEAIVLTPGESVCLEQCMYHRFYGEEGHGLVLVGEVSMVNDDTIDNRFYEAQGRFSEIEEDEAPVHLLANDYLNYIK